MENMEEEKMKMIVFDEKKIRRVWNNDEWYYSVVDVVSILTESVNSRDYWYKLKIRELEHHVQLSTNCLQLKLRETDCANKEGIFRIIQSIPSRRAEPFKLWLAKVGSDRVNEIENPELIQELYVEEKNYKAKNFNIITNSNIGFMFPGDLRVARCFSFFGGILK